MKLFPWQKDKDIFSPEEQEIILEAIRKAEQRKSGEIRLFVEPKCRFMDPVDRAKEVFFELKMHETQLQNGTLIYIAFKDHQAAIYGDEGIHQKVGQQYWETEMNMMLRHFKEHHLVEGICNVVNDIGEALHQHFPFDSETDKNELPDDIVFGK